MKRLTLIALMAWTFSAWAVNYPDTTTSVVLQYTGPTVNLAAFGQVINGQIIEANPLQAKGIIGDSRFAVVKINGVSCSSWYAGSPEGNVIGYPGWLCWDATNNALYAKDTGEGTTTGWIVVSGGVGGAGVSGLTANTVAMAQNATNLVDSPIKITGAINATMAGNFTPNAVVVTNGVTDQSLTASVVTGTDGSKRLVSSTLTVTEANALHTTPPYIPGGTDVAIADGGTGASTAAAALDGLITAEATVASATTTDLGAVTSQNVQITGTTTITSFGTKTAGTIRRGRFAGILTLTHSGTALILPGGANITTAANDRFEAISLGSGNWLVYYYVKADGTAIVGSGGGTTAIANGGTGQTTAAAAIDALSAAAEASVASATTTDLGAQASQQVLITGPTTITGFGTVAAGTRRWIRFAAALTLTHNSSSLILPTAANITTVAGDTAIAISLGAGNWRVYSYQRADGTALTGAGSISGLTSGIIPVATASTTIGNGPISVNAGTNTATTGNGTFNAIVATNGVTVGNGSAAGFEAWLDGGTHYFSILPQTMSGNYNFRPDTAPTTGIPYHTATTTNSVETHLASVSIALGGTGQTTAAAALDSLITAEANVASATTTDLGAQTTRNVNITGTTTITSLGTVAAGVMRVGRFAGILTLTHSGTALILPGAANITTAANDRFAAVSLGSGNWLVYFYQKADGTPVVYGTVPIANGGTAATTAIGALDSLITAEATVASATTTDLGAVTSQNVQITGTTTITGFGTKTAGTIRRGRFAAALTLTHSGTALILPGAANITTAANDRFEAVSLGSGNWFVYYYVKADGTAIVGSGGGTVGTLINTASTAAGQIVKFTDTTKTNTAPSTAFSEVLTNGTVAGDFFSYSANTTATGEGVLSQTNSGSTFIYRQAPNASMSGNVFERKIPAAATGFYYGTASASTNQVQSIKASVSLTADVSGTLPIGNGGTGQTTANASEDALQQVTETTVASATTTDLGAVASQKVSITGTTTITGFGTVAAGTVRKGRFTGILTLTYNASSLILPGAASITTAAGDAFEALSLGSGNWVVYYYAKAGWTGTGSQVFGTSPTIATPQITTSLNFNGDTPVGREGAAIVQLGTDAGAATAQTLKAHDGSGTDIAGASLTFAGGQSTGTGRGGDLVLKTTPSATTGSGANTYSERYHASAKHVVLTEGSATTIANITCASGKSIAGEISASVNADDGTNFQMVETNLKFAAVNKSGTITASIDQVQGTVATSSGTLTPVTFTIVANGNSVDIKCAATSSLTQTTLNCEWAILALNGNAAAVVTAQ